MELDILVSIGVHPNLVQFKGACLFDKENPILFEEFVQGPSLEAFFTEKMESSYKYKPPRTVQYAWIMDMMRALEFLHNRDPVIMSVALFCSSLCFQVTIRLLAVTVT